MTPEPKAQDETANNSDDSPADGIQGDHADQQECEHHQGGAALTGVIVDVSGDQYVDVQMEALAMMKRE